MRDSEHQYGIMKHRTCGTESEGRKAVRVARPSCGRCMRRAMSTEEQLKDMHIRAQNYRVRMYRATRDREAIKATAAHSLWHAIRERARPHGA